MDDKSSCARPGVVVFACGNLSRGDDAIGPILIERLEAWLEQEGLIADFELIYNYQFQIEHALELQDRRLALFIDAGTGTPAPFSFYETQPSADVAYTSHTMSPEAVLGVWVKIEKCPPPPSFVMCVRGDEFELGAEMGLAAKANLEAAFSRLQELCQRADVAFWR